MPAPAAHATLHAQHPFDLARAVGWIDARARDARGRRLGRVSGVLADREGRPWWLIVRRRGRAMLAPVASVAEEAHGGLLLDCTREELESSPGCGCDELTPSLHEALLRHFGLTAGKPSSPPVRDACAVG